MKYNLGFLNLINTLFVFKNKSIYKIFQTNLPKAVSHDQINMTEIEFEYDQKCVAMININILNMTG